MCNTQPLFSLRRQNINQKCVSPTKYEDVDENKSCVLRNIVIFQALYMASDGMKHLQNCHSLIIVMYELWVVRSSTDPVAATEKRCRVNVK